LHNAEQFSLDRAPSGGVNTASVNCGGYDFLEFPDISIAQAMQGTDNPLGLQQLVNLFSVANSTSFTFAVYRNLQMGATFVLPKSAVLQPSNSGCIATIPGSALALIIDVRQHVPNLAAVTQVSSQFEQAILYQNPHPWNYDPAGSYALPQARFDGFMVTRKHFASSQPPASVFETLADKNGVFMGIASYNPTGVSTVQAAGCYANQAIPGCAALLQLWIHIAEAEIAVHLATFPVG
jgi:hypothetical protein